MAGDSRFEGYIAKMVAAGKSPLHAGMAAGRAARRVPGAALRFPRKHPFYAAGIGMGGSAATATYMMHHRDQQIGHGSPPLYNYPQR